MIPFCTCFAFGRCPMESEHWPTETVLDRFGIELKKSAKVTSLIIEAALLFDCDGGSQSTPTERMWSIKFDSRKNWNALEFVLKKGGGEVDKRKAIRIYLTIWYSTRFEQANQSVRRRHSNSSANRAIAIPVDVQHLKLLVAGIESHLLVRSTRKTRVGRLSTCKRRFARNHQASNKVERRKALVVTRISLSTKKSRKEEKRLEFRRHFTNAFSFSIVISIVFCRIITCQSNDAQHQIEIALLST